MSFPPPLPPRNLFDYDQVVNTQRDRVYAERRRALLSTDLTPLMMDYAEKTCDDILEVCVGVGLGGGVRGRGWRKLYFWGGGGWVSQEASAAFVSCICQA
jgi:hypothetical protein